jgi:hypothetical protein
MANVLLSASNGISVATRYTVTAADQSAGYVQFELTNNNAASPAAANFYLVATWNLLSSAGAVVTPVGGIVTYPSVGIVKIANGGSVSLTAGQFIDIIIQRYKVKNT